MNPTGVDPAARHQSPWSLRAKLARALWSALETTLFRWSPQPCYRWRNWLLRRFGAQIHAEAHIRQSVKIELPWHLTIGANSAVGDHAILYCLGPITIGERVTISQYSHLCTGTHDYTQPDMPLRTLPIRIEDDVWVATDVFVAPGVTIGMGAVVGARSSVFKDVEAWTIVGGNPAKFIKKRESLLQKDGSESIQEPRV